MLKTELLIIPSFNIERAIASDMEEKDKPIDEILNSDDDQENREETSS